MQAPGVEEGGEQSRPVIEALGLEAAEQEKMRTGVLLRVEKSERTRLDDNILRYLLVRYLPAEPSRPVTFCSAAIAKLTAACSVMKTGRRQFAELESLSIYHTSN